MTGPIILPEFDPFVINFGGFGIQLVRAWPISPDCWRGTGSCGARQRRPGAVMTAGAIDSLLNHVLIGVILGGRIGYVLFYNPAFFPPIRQRSSRSGRAACPFMAALPASRCDVGLCAQTGAARPSCQRPRRHGDPDRAVPRDGCRTSSTPNFRAVSPMCPGP